MGMKNEKIGCSGWATLFCSILIVALIFGGPIGGGAALLLGGICVVVWAIVKLMLLIKHGIKQLLKRETLTPPAVIREEKTLCLPSHIYQLEDLVEIIEKNGIIEIFEKDFSRVEKMSFGCLENPCRLRYESYRVNFVPLFTISCILPGTTQQVEFKYDPNIDGIFNRIVSPGQEIANEGRLLMFIDIRKEALEEWDRMAERRKREEAEAWEKRQMAERIKERHRKRELEKLVRQELIERGEIMVEAKRPPIPKDIADAVYQRDGGKCVYCGASENLQFDHIIPFSKGGATTIENLQLLCQKCNLEKSNHIG